jgi:hypothetical protein
MALCGLKSVICIFCCVLKSEGYSKATISATSSVLIDMAENSEILIYGKPMIELKRFDDSAVLRKKPMK